MAAKKKTRKTGRKTGKKRTSTKTSTRRRRSSRKKATARGRGRRLTEAEQQRRVEALRKHGTKNSPEPLTAQQIADKLGMNVGTWNVWKSNQRKGRGTRSAPTKRRGRPQKSASSLDVVIAGFREVERERDQLRRGAGQDRECVR